MFTKNILQIAYWLKEEGVSLWKIKVYISADMEHSLSDIQNIKKFKIWILRIFINQILNNCILKKKKWWKC